MQNYIFLPGAASLASFLETMRFLNSANVYERVCSSIVLGV